VQQRILSLKEIHVTDAMCTESFAAVSQLFALSVQVRSVSTLQHGLVAGANFLVHMALFVTTL
jgi:hypothetical protein